LTTRSSVSVIAPDCTTADGLASALSVLGPDKGVALADRLPDVAAFVVFVQDGEIVTRASRRFPDNEPAGEP
jgi:thiamine biosynthesis lipoprotein